MVTIIADNYYGYCKKEVKTQISFSANLYGLCEEEHAGGAMASAAYVLGQDFHADQTISLKKTILRRGDATFWATWWSRGPAGMPSTGAIPTFTMCPKTPSSNCGKARVWWKQEGHGRN